MKFDERFTYGYEVFVALNEYIPYIYLIVLFNNTFLIIRTHTHTHTHIHLDKMDSILT